MSEWISVKDRLPEGSGEVLLFFRVMDLTCISVEWYSLQDNEFLPADEEDKKLNKPTHWMPIPEPPEDKL